LETNDKLERIKKLLAMARDDRGNENESQTAMLKAQKLMVEYGINEAQLIEKPINEVKDNTVTGHGDFKQWHGQLGQIIADNFKCFCYIRNRRNIKNGKLLKSVSFVGLTDDLKIGKEVYHYAVMMIEYHTKLYLIDYKVKNPGKNSYKDIENSYIQGYLKGLFTKFKEQREQHKHEWALVLRRDDRINDYLQKLGLFNGRKSKLKMSENQEHFAQGYKKGKEFEVVSGYVEN